VKVLRLIYRLLMTVITVAVIVQIGAAGYGAFHAANGLKDKGDTFKHEQWDHGWSFHGGFGWLIVYAILLALVLALLARVGRPRIWWQLGLAVAGVLQVVFALAGEDHAWVGIFHPLNALVIAAVAGQITGREWRAASASAQPAPAQ
jgi:putative copper export protein